MAQGINNTARFAQAGSSIPFEADIVFCGGGTTAGIIAGRLATRDPSLRILILEAGSHTFNIDKHIQPALFPVHLLPESKATRPYVAQTSQALNNRNLIALTGKCLGGGSSINFACYTQAATSDYDDWASIYGNEGWGAKDLIPMIHRAESFDAHPQGSHGINGPLKISDGGIFTTSGREFLDILPKLHPHVESVGDANNFSQSNVCSRWNKYIDSTTGRRSDIPHGYLYNQQQNQNLFIATGVLVTRVLLDQNKAVTVEYQHDTDLHTTQDAGMLHLVKATKLIVVSAGAFGSPAILERSGIGQENIIRSLGIQPIISLDGVGENYMDHPLISTHFHSSPESITLDAIHLGDEKSIREATNEWEKSGGGLLATNGEDAGAKLRLNEDDLLELGPACRKRYNAFMSDAKDKTAVLMLSVASKILGNASDLGNSKHFSLHSALMHPMSVGKTHIASSTDVLANPKFEDDFLTHQEDVDMLVWAYKRMREIARRMPSYRGEVADMHPHFPQGSKGETNENSHPMPIDTPNIIWTKEDDQAIEEWVRNTVNSMHHSMGTCGMKSQNVGGVVDNKLNVYGTLGLKVADLSICPANVGANTYSTAIAIGERAAVIIAEELGLA